MQYDRQYIIRMEHISIEEILQIDVDTTIDFEITIAAFLSAILLISPNVSPPLYPVTILVAIGMLFLTLLRRMVFINPFSLDFLDSVTPALSLMTSYSFLYVFFVLGWFTKQLIPFITFHVSSIALLYVVVFVPISVALYELVFRDFLMMLSIFVFNRHVDHRGTLLGRFALRIAQWMLNKSVLPENRIPKQVKLIEETQPLDPSETDIVTRASTTAGMILGVIAFTGVVSSALLVPYLLFPSLIRIVYIGVLLGVATNYLIISTRFLYARYGQSTYEAMASPTKSILHSTILYAAFAIHLFYEYNVQVL